MSTKPKEYDIYTQSGDFVTTTLASSGWPWASRRFFIVAGIIFLAFLIISNMVRLPLQWIFNYSTIGNTSVSLIIGGFLTYKGFKRILEAGDGTMIHRADAGGSEEVTFYDFTLAPDKWGGGFSLEAYGPDLAFKWPGTRPEGTLDLSIKYTIMGVEKEGKDDNCFSVTCGKAGETEDEVIIDGICTLRRTIRYAYVTFIATRNFKNLEETIEGTTRSMMNNALDLAAKSFTKEELIGGKFPQFAKLASLLFRDEFKKLQKTDPVFRGLAFMNKEGVKFSNPRDNKEVQKGRNEKARRILLASATDDAALAKMKIADTRNEPITLEEASKSVRIDAGVVVATDDKNSFRVDTETLSGIAEIIKALKGGGK